MEIGVKEGLDRCYVILRRPERQDTAIVLCPGMEMHIFDQDEESFDKLFHQIEEATGSKFVPRGDLTSVVLYAREKLEDDLQEKVELLEDATYASAETVALG